MSQPREIRDPSAPLSTYPSDSESLSIPKKSGTKSKRTVSRDWDCKYSDLDPKELLLQRTQAGQELSSARKRLKRHSSMDAEYWDRYSEVARLVQETSQIESQKRLDDTLEDEQEAKDWYESAAADTLEKRYHSWKQFSTIMKRHKKTLQGRKDSPRESWVKLFTSSKLGMGLATNNIDMGMGTRNTRDQAKFKKALIKAHCPNPPADGYTWDPVVGEWFEYLIAAHLFPYSQGMFMDDIFGKGSRKELFSPVNGLLLHPKIKYALDKGWVVIVPDIELEPADPDLPLNDQEERCNRVKAWEKQKVKEYKLIVLNTTDSKMTAKTFLSKHGTYSIADLDGRRLNFLTNFRPRARYIWWTYLNAILRSAWTQKSTESNIQHMEIRKCTRYWGSRACYVKQNQLLGFIEEVGHDVESILEVDTEKVTGEPGLEAISALVGDAMLTSQDDDDEYETTSEEDSNGEE